MNKPIFLILFCLVLGTRIIAQNKSLTLNEIFQEKKFKEAEIQGLKFLADGFSYARLWNNKIIRFNIADGVPLDTIFNGDEILDARIKDRVSDCIFSDDEQKIILICAKELIYRHSFKSEVWVYDLNTKKISRVNPKSKIKYPSFNSSGDKVAFVLENDIYYQHLSTGNIIRVTHDGRINQIINGSSDWVYEEEFMLTKAYEWSPKGDQILYLKIDESKVEEFSTLLYKEDLYPRVQTFKYPKVGCRISLVTAWNYQLKGNKTNSLNFSHLIKGDYYLPRIQWLPDNQNVCLAFLNRAQNQISYLIGNAGNGSSRLLLNKKSTNYILLGDPLVFSPDLQYFLFRDNCDGYHHLYKYNLDGKVISQLTSGVNEVTSVLYTNFLSSEVYCQRSEILGIDRKIYKVNLNNAESECLTPKPGYHEAFIDKKGRYILVSNSEFNKPPEFWVLDSLGAFVAKLERNEKLLNIMKEYNLSMVEHQVISNRNGDSLNSIMIKPLDFSPNKKYPVLMYVYGAPGKQEVLNKWNSFRYYWWFQFLAQNGYIIFLVDNRGTPGRGDLFLKLTHRQLGRLELEDQVDAALFLRTKTYVDTARIGIFGWSYGGFMSSLGIFKYGNIFRAAVAGAPVSNWRWYDCVYAERYMGSEVENKQAYLDCSLVNLTYGLKGSFLLIHGLADDNVHFQHSAELMNSLIINNKQFDSALYPNSKHSIANEMSAYHLFTKITQFIYEKI
ncbi:MAG TPA: DPP IV N-terminal domain-containing protein [Saprospiraceae bacterium]|nr:DPP IV N-terminal domain-containing protein [Saprospiraceae bacterium]